MLAAPSKAKSRREADINLAKRAAEGEREREERARQETEYAKRLKQDKAEYSAARDAFCEANGYSRLKDAGFFIGQWVRPDGFLGDDFMSFNEWISQRYPERDDDVPEWMKTAHQREQDALWGTYDDDGNRVKS
jgi:hypothetical protein